MEKKTRVKRTYAERQSFRRDQLGHLTEMLGKASAKAPDEWGTAFRAGVGKLAEAVAFLASVQIPSDYATRPTSNRAKRLTPGTLVMIRSAARRESYRAIAPAIDRPGTLLELTHQDGIRSAFVQFGDLQLGPIPLRYLALQGEENLDDEDEDEDDAADDDTGEE